MSSSFFGLEIAKTGLFVAQKNINLTGHNIANAGTDGYSRQRIVQQSIDPYVMNSRFANPDQGAVGGGTRVQILQRIRDSFIDKALRSEYDGAYKLLAQEESLLNAEKIFNELSTTDAKLSAGLENFFNAWNEQHTDAASSTFRVNIRETAITLCTILNHYYDKLVGQQEDLNTQMEQTANRVNDIMHDIAYYNEKIYAFELSSEPANDLRDKRDLLLDELSQLIDIAYNEDPDPVNPSLARLRVWMEGSGQEIINHKEYAVLDTVSAGLDPLTGINLSKFVFSSSTSGGPAIGSDLLYASGRMDGLRQQRDGNSSADYGIPYIITELNKLANALVTEFNAIHTTAWTIPKDDNGNVSADGYHFFDPANTTAGTISISSDVATSIWYIATSENVITGTPSDLWGDNEKVLEILTLLDHDNVPGLNASFENFYADIVSGLAAESKKTQNLTDAQIAVATNLETQRESVSGVSLDEEAALLLKFQHMYTANSRMITAIDECLDVLINRTGVVGL
ncbi:MAG: flagellar hook-associated protein FlgK [Clostridiales bacterium]|jgi:flagellar hook-associated protein 1 FlgK|nr:flagellar hook-associated protein FlgK [Clostridiales bacterium]